MNKTSRYVLIKLAARKRTWELMDRELHIPIASIQCDDLTARLLGELLAQVQ